MINNIKIINHILLIAWILFGILGSLVFFLNVLYKNKQLFINDILNKFWIRLNQSIWFELPIKIITALEYLKVHISQYLGYNLRHNYKFLWTIRMIQPFILAFGCLLLWNWIIALIVFLLNFIELLIQYTIENYPMVLHFSRSRIIPVGLLILTVFEFLAIPIIWTIIIVKKTTVFFLFSLVILAPYYCIGLSIIISIIISSLLHAKKFKEQKFFNGTLYYNQVLYFIFSIISGIALTIIALIIGKIGDQSLRIMISFQLVSVSVIFNILMIYISYYLLKNVVNNFSIIKTLGIILIVLIISSLLACLSLYFSVLGTKLALSIKEVLNVFLAKSIDGSVISLGQFFWLMHTTFFPVIIYVLILFLSILAKMLLIIVKLITKGVKDHVEPLKLTYAFLGIITAILFGFYNLTNYQISKSINHAEYNINTHIKE